LVLVIFFWKCIWMFVCFGVCEFKLCIIAYIYVCEPTSEMSRRPISVLLETLCNVLHNGSCLMLPFFVVTEREE
jgi:hypothetical protein